MIHELREYRFTEPNWQRYEKLFRDVCWPLRRHAYGQLHGAWTTRHGEDTVGFVHLWAYESLDARARLRAELLAKPGWVIDFIEPVKPLLLRQTLSVQNPAAPQPSAAVPSSAYLHRVRCAVGRAAPVVAELQRETPFVWTTEFSDPNEVASISTEPVLAVVAAPGESIAAYLRSVRTAPLEAYELAHHD